MNYWDIFDVDFGKDIEDAKKALEEYEDKEVGDEHEGMIWNEYNKRWVLII